MKLPHILWIGVFLLHSCICRPEEPRYKLCFPSGSANPFAPPPEVHALKGYGTNCKGCDHLKNCTTLDGSLEIQRFRSSSSEGYDAMKKTLYFPKLTEITGYLIVFLLHNSEDLKGIFPNLAVIRGKNLLLDYSLVIYQNQGLKRINLPSLSVILSGGIRIEKNINLCYAKTIRWKSIMKMNSDDPSALVTASNNNDCYDMCYKGKCFPPAGHGASGSQFCWGAGTPYDYACQNLCKTKCGDAGCVRGSSQLCCHSQCLGGCLQLNSPFHCHACKYLRHPSGECVSKCPEDLLEIDNFKCISSRCPRSYFQLEKKCVKMCPAGYEAKQAHFFSPGTCEKCVNQRCPKICKLEIGAKDHFIDSLNALRGYKGCTEIVGNLIIQIRGGSSSISNDLEENLGMLEKVNGYILIRESVTIVSLKFLKSLKLIEPRTTVRLPKNKQSPMMMRPLLRIPLLYSDRYALTIMDNPKLEKMWDFYGNLTIVHGGVLVRMNPRLCPNDIEPLVTILRTTNETTSGRPIDISKTTNGNDMACQVQTINLTVTEIVRPGRLRCADVCIETKWKEVRISDDYRDVLFYTISYREAPHTAITEFDDIGGCSSKTVWTKVDIPANRAKSENASSNNRHVIPIMVRRIGALKPHTLYAIYVEVVTLNKKGARSSLQFLKTREMVPSAVVGLDASYLDYNSLLVKWKPPLYPNGNITKYIITYQESDYSVWEQENIDWCIRQVVPRTSRSPSTGNKNPNKPGVCNVTCNCDDNKDNVIKPEKQAAIFAKEFQDKLYSAIFTKDKDKDDTTPTPQPTNVTTIPATQPTFVNNTNCSGSAQGGECTTPPPTSSESTTASSLPSTPLMNGTTTPNNAMPTTPPTKVVITKEVNGTERQLLISGLRHFADYTVVVCACTSAGCALGTKCSSTKGRTGKKSLADNLGGPLKVEVENATRWFNISWIPPKDPNAVVLKYDIEIMHVSRTSPEFICRQASLPTWINAKGLYGNYTANVRAITPAGNGSWSKAVFYIAKDIKDDNGKAKVHSGADVGMIIGASLATCSVIILVCGLVVWYITRKRYTDKQIHTVLYASVNPEYMNSSDVYIADEWEVARDKIKLIRELGQGSFGMVYEGEAIDIVKDQPRCRVAVKTVSENASVKDRIEFLHEASIMKAFRCYHVVELLGVVSDGQPTLVIMELMHNGDLKNHLRSRRPGEGGALPPPTLSEMLQMAGEIADGMAYLASRKFVHRDLAARNCMVNENLTVKIGDFGMTRDIYETDYYRKGGKGLLPVRWMAPESLKDGVFTSPSDVWSYGVVLWEMVTLASQPYYGKSNEEVLKFIVDGGVMEKPPDAPQEFFELMTMCWQFKPKIRPTFFSIINMIEDRLSEDFKKMSFYSSLPREHLQEMLRTLSFHVPRQRAETIQTEVESSA